MLKTILTLGVGFYLGGATLMALVAASFGAEPVEVVTAALTWPAMGLEIAAYLIAGTA